MQPRHLYRRLFRELASQHVEAAVVQDAKSAHKLEALNAYRLKSGQTAKGAAEQKPVTVASYNSSSLREAFASTQADTKFGLQIVEYLRHQRTYKILLDRYNPGANMEPQERIRLSAKRVGLELPL